MRSMLLKFPQKEALIEGLVSKSEAELEKMMELLMSAEQRFFAELEETGVDFEEEINRYFKKKSAELEDSINEEDLQNIEQEFDKL